MRLHLIVHKPEWLSPAEPGPLVADNSALGATYLYPAWQTGVSSLLSERLNLGFHLKDTSRRPSRCPAIHTNTKQISVHTPNLTFSAPATCYSIRSRNAIGASIDVLCGSGVAKSQPKKCNRVTLLLVYAIPLVPSGTLLAPGTET